MTHLAAKGLNIKGFLSLSLYIYIYRKQCLKHKHASSPNNISRYISLTLVSSLKLKVGEKRIRVGLKLFELTIKSMAVMFYLQVCLIVRLKIICSPIYFGRTVCWLFVPHCWQVPSNLFHQL